MKIMWHSVAPWLPTGYGQQSALFAPRIRDLGHDVAFSSYVGLEGTMGSYEGMPVYPADITKWNKIALKGYVERHGQGEEVLVITLQDVWAWTEVRYGGMADFHGLNLAPWTPVDHDPCPDRVVDALQRYNARPIAMSRFGEDRLRRKGLDPLYIPHGVDTNVYQPWSNREEVRGLLGLPKDRFVMGMVANNSGPVIHRKAIPHVLMAFSLFLQKHDDAILYLHTDRDGINNGMNLVNQCMRFGIPERSVAFVKQDAYWLGDIAPEQMSLTYACMDVLVNPSLGEGFGVPIIEAQACGTPVIVTEWTSMTELCGAGWLVDGDEWWHDAQDSYWKQPALSEIVNAMEQAYEQRGNQDLRDKARAFALQYDADLITREYWQPVLDVLAGPREVPPLNRAQRRQKTKAAA